MSTNIILLCGVGALRTDCAKESRSVNHTSVQTLHTEQVFNPSLPLLSPVTSVEFWSNCSSQLCPWGRCCTSFIPAYNSAEGPREDGGVTVEKGTGHQGLWALYAVLLLGMNLGFSLQWLHFFLTLWRNAEKAAILSERHFKSRNACWPCVSTLGLVSYPFQCLSSPLLLFHTQMLSTSAHTSRADIEHSPLSNQVQQ